MARRVKIPVKAFLYLRAYSYYYIESYYNTTTTVRVKLFLSFSLSRIIIQSFLYIQVQILLFCCYIIINNIQNSRFRYNKLHVCTEIPRGFPTTDNDNKYNTPYTTYTYNIMITLYIIFIETQYITHENGRYSAYYYTLL